MICPRFPRVVKHSRIAARSYVGFRGLSDGGVSVLFPRGPSSRNTNVIISKRFGRQQRWFCISKSSAEQAINQAVLQRVLEKYKSSLTIPEATHDISVLHYMKNVDSSRFNVVLHGYLGQRVDISKLLSFVPLSDKKLTHVIQILSSGEAGNGADRLHVHAKLKTLAPNTPVVIHGVLRERHKPAQQKSVGKLQLNKSYEIVLSGIQALNVFPKDIIALTETVHPPEQRHLQIRTERSLRSALHTRAAAATYCRDFFRGQGFLEVETPLLFKSTPEGAREFMVPTRRNGLFYALPQSPQQYKQILMASGIPKYYQLAKCFRDEDLRADRQPEFTQLDMEMSFSTGKNVIRCIEELIRNLWNHLLRVELPAPFPTLTYEKAMSQYGTDKPDTRFDSKIKRVEYMLPADLISKISPLSSPIVEAIMIPLSTSDGADPFKTREFIGKFLDSPEAKPYHDNAEGGPGVFVYDSAQPLRGFQSLGFEAAENIEEMFGTNDGDLIILQARTNAPFSGSSTPLGNLRTALNEAAITQEFFAKSKNLAPLWVVDFPLFSPSHSSEPGQGGNAGLSSTHHPFTSPKTEEDIDQLLIDPSKVIGDHYDLVINGVELGGGSRRIHNAEVQEFIMRDILKMPPERIAEFAHLLEALRAGCPPHAGFAIGFDRLVAMLLGKESVRDVIAFPKSGKGEDMMVKSPGVVSEETLKTYHLQLTE